MILSPRRIAGALLALVALAVLLLGQTQAQRTRDRSLRSLAIQAAGQRSSAAHDWLGANLLKEMEREAASAASLQQIKGVVGNPEALQSNTLLDLFRTEPWWDSYRHDFSLQGVAVDGDQLDVVNTTATLDAKKLDLAPVIREARANRKASLLLRVGALNWPYVAAAAVIDVPRSTPAVLVLAKAFDQGVANELAKAINGSLVLSDGTHALLSAGPLAPQAAPLLPGRENQNTFISPDLTWAAAFTPLMPGLTLWTAASVGEGAKEFDADLQSGLLLARILAGVLGLVALLLLIWPAAAPAIASTGTTGGQLAAAPVSGASGITAAPASTGNTGNSNAIVPPLVVPPAPSALAPGQTAPDTRLSAPSGSSDPRLRKPASTGLTAETEGVTALQSAPVLPSNVFGRYVLLDLLGEGGMAEVYTAVTYGAERFRRSFVVKRLRAEMLHNKTVVSSFIDEANLASSLVHSNILPVFDFGKIGDEYYMATEYILGRDLGKLSRQAFEVDGAPLPLGLIFFAAHQTLEALDYAHHKKGDDGVPLGIVHRDISPNNILVSARGEVKLFDFGIAKAEGRLTQTTFGTVKGNVRFMSPEQARGEPVDPRSDLFSVGLVIYFALTGEAFYEGDTAYSLLVKAAHGPGEAERARLAKLPKEARAILERALALDPAHRFQGAAEFAAALSPYIAGQQAALGRMMERLFGQELHEEQTRFAAAAAAVGDAEKAEAAPAHEASKA